MYEILNDDDKIHYSSKKRLMEFVNKQPGRNKVGRSISYS